MALHSPTIIKISYQISSRCSVLTDRCQREHRDSLGETEMSHIFIGQDPESFISITRRLRLNGQSTSIRLESAFWGVIDFMAKQDGLSTPALLSRLHSEVLEQYGEVQNFTSLLRCACVVFLGDMEKSPKDPIQGHLA